MLRERHFCLTAQQTASTSSQLFHRENCCKLFTTCWVVIRFSPTEKSTVTVKSLSKEK